MTSLILFLGVFFILAMLVKTPVPFSMGIATVVVFLALGLPTINMAQAAFSALDTFPLLAVPLFILSGTIMEYSGISKALLDWIDSFIGGVKSYLGIVTIFGSAAFGVLTGAAIATLSAIGKIMAPTMIAKGYRRSYVAALLAATCFLGILIPPSVPGIMYSLSANARISDVWLSTIIPAFIFCGLYLCINYFAAKKMNLSGKAAVQPGEYVANIGKKSLEAIPALLMPVVIFGSIYGGICTPTEAGALSVFYGIIYFFVKKIYFRDSIQVNMRSLFISSGITASIIAVLIIFSNVSSRAVTLSGVSSSLSALVTANISSPAVFLLIVNLIYLFMGTFMDINCSILLMTPLLAPPARALGIDPVHFGAITCVNLSVGLMTPPFAAGIFMACKITGAGYIETVREILPFIFAGLVVIALTTYVPWISLAIPNLFK